MIGHCVDRLQSARVDIKHAVFSLAKMNLKGVIRAYMQTFLPCVYPSTATPKAYYRNSRLNKMGASQRIKTKYVFRLPIPFLKTKRMNTKEKHVDETGEGSENSAYANTNIRGPRPVRVTYESESEDESEIECDEDGDIDPLETNIPVAPSRPKVPGQRKRLVSWDGVKEQARSRWTVEQEERLEHARAELARCQKAWSSEQEVWIKCVSIRQCCSLVCTK